MPFLFIGALFEGIKAAFISYWIAIPLGWIGYWVVVKALRIFLVSLLSLKPFHQFQPQISYTMKRFVLIVLINSFLGFFIISCCDEDTPKPQDPCSEIRCGSHGSCKSGRCECETGYKGSECEISLKPLGFRVEKVLLVDWDDNNWDSSSGSGVLSGGPDWYIRWAQWKSGGKN